MNVYRVKGHFNYRDHKPGTTFIAALPREEEARALARGNIELVLRSPVALDPSKIRKPKG